MDEIHAMNALKALLTTISNAVAMLLFIVAHAVYWPEAILMIVGSVLGGYFGAHFAQKTKPEYVRSMVIAIGFALIDLLFRPPDLALVAIRETLVFHFILRDRRQRRETAVS